MYYVYILQSKKDNRLYIGCTNDLRKRYKMHSQVKVPATQHRTPFKLVCYEAFTNRDEAFGREQWLKTGYGRNHLKKMLPKTLKSLGG